ncbi:MAG: LPS export ABC transporter periplasmic protein LptC [Bacteroidales bacterium]|nr:LPS export ABC transporter periplasmic protein LptC [Bacteroidales bacterium]
MLKAKYIWLPLMLLMAAWGMASCSEEKLQKAATEHDPEKVPTMVTHDAHTIVSDSGRTRYRINTKLWNIYSEARVPHWTFPNGLVADELDEKFNNKASLICDSGYYDIQKRMWSAVGNVRLTMRSGDRILCDRMYYDEKTTVVNCMDNVRITRTSGDKIETNQMFYNTRTRRTYGDTFIHIEGSGRVIEGYGYEYWDDSQRYVVRRVQGIFPIDDRRFRPH